MDAKKAFKSFLNDLRTDFPETEFTPFKESDIPDFEKLCTPNILKILQRDESMFEGGFTVFGVDMMTLFPKKKEMFWKNIQACVIASFLHGDVKEKLSGILDTIKSLWGGAGHSTDEIDKLLGNEETQSKVGELIDFVMKTKLATIVTSMVNDIDISELGIDLENPEEVLKSFQDMQNNPLVEKFMKKIQGILEDKVRRGEFTKEVLVRDIESIKVKVQEMFGDMFNDMLGGRQAAVPASVLLGNSPEARRARMLSRLQRKLKERKTS